MALKLNVEKTGIEVRRLVDGKSKNFSYDIKFK